MAVLGQNHSRPFLLTFSHLKLMEAKNASRCTLHLPINEPNNVTLQRMLTCGLIWSQWLGWRITAKPQFLADSVRVVRVPTVSLSVLAVCHYTDMPLLKIIQHTRWECAVCVRIEGRITGAQMGYGEHKMLKIDYCDRWSKRNPCRPFFDSSSVSLLGSSYLRYYKWVLYSLWGFQSFCDRICKDVTQMYPQTFLFPSTAFISINCYPLPGSFSEQKLLLLSVTSSPGLQNFCRRRGWEVSSSKY